MILSKKIWGFLALSSLSILFFALNYCTSVCPFIDGLRNEDILVNLTIIFIFHMITRVILVKSFHKPFKNVTPYRQQFYLSVISWILAGIYAAVLHAILYPDFPIESHAKLLSGYWLIGAGVLSQLEYVLFESSFKKENPNIQLDGKYNETLSRRILEGFIIFTLLPTTTLILLVGRYYYEKKIDGHLIQETLYTGIFSVVTAIVVAIMIGRLLSRDTKEITDSIEEIHEGNYSKQLQLGRVDELGDIANGINFMNKGLQEKKEIENAFGKFVDPNIANRFIDEYISNKTKNINFKGEKEEFAILMCDIRNFTPLSEELSAHQIVELLNDFFDISVQTIQKNNGVINKFIGDAIMVIYGINDKTNKEIDALNTAIQMQENMTELNNTLNNKGLPSISIGIGLHSGEVVSGYLGSSSRLEFTVIGSAVNLTARIESETKNHDTNILFSEEFNEKVSQNFETKHITSTHLKGISKEICLYSIK
jgi:adenylate cyclase